ncbi:hypothetical protein M8J75_016378 [Diaphorina citri]|nr:hypothetical protein M8J75_016378 [Diaphorina citri]
MPLFQINLDLFPMKLHYFLWNAGTAPIVPFIPTLAKQLGFSPVTVGTMYTFLPIFGLLAKPLFGAISDRFKVQKVLFLSFIVLTAATFYGILYIPTATRENQVLLECGEGKTQFKYCADVPTDVCTKNKILAAGKNTTYRCEVLCHTQDPAFLEALCRTWHVPKFCSPSVPTTPPQFYNALIPIPGAHNISKKFDPTQVGKYDIAPGKTPRSLTPGVAVSSGIASTEVKSCLHFPITHVRFNSENKSTSHLPVCTNPIDVPQCSVSCDNPDLMSYLDSGSTPDDVTNTAQFWTFFILLSLSWVGMAVVVSLGDTICFEILGNEPQKYGKQRLWGAVGWGIFSILAGFLVDHYSASSLNKNYTPVFYLMLAILLFDLFVSSKIKSSRIPSVSSLNKNYTPVFYLMLAILLFDLFVSSKIKNVQSSISPNILKDVTKLLGEPRVLAFLFWCICVGVCTAMVWQYLFWFLEDLATAQGCEYSTWMKTLQGLVMTVQCFGGELPFFFLSGWFLRKLGHINSMSLVLLGFAVRFYLYAMLTNPWGAVPIELLNGVTFGLFWPTMASYANIIAAPGTEATIQGLVGAVFEGVGVSLGSQVGGWIFTYQGGSSTFQLFGHVGLIMCGIHLVWHYVLKTKARYGMEASVKDVNQSARYASPTEAIHMLEDVTT